MKINGKDIKFEFTIGAKCDYIQYCSDNPDALQFSANLYKALYMNRAYAENHEGAETVTVEELRRLKAYAYEELMAEVKAAEEADSRRTVETQEKKENVKQKS